MRLTRLDETESEPGQFRDTRQRVALPALTPAGSDPERLRALVQRLADARLLVTTTDPETDETQVEVSHEALIRHWPRLRGWLDEDRASWILLAAVRQQAQDWHAGGEQDTDLPRWGERLQAAQTLFAQPRFAPTDTERRFVAAARDLDARERAEKERQQRERLEALERPAARSKDASRESRDRARASPPTLLARAPCFWASSRTVQKRGRSVATVAEEQAREARPKPRTSSGPMRSRHARTSASIRPASGTPPPATYAAAQAPERVGSNALCWRSEPHLTTAAALGQQATRPRRRCVRGQDLRGEPEVSRILTWSADGTARLWDVATGDPLTPPLKHESWVGGAPFSHDESRILTWSEDGTARLWEAATGDPLTPPLGHKDRFMARRLAATSPASLPGARTTPPGCGTRPPATQSRRRSSTTVGFWARRSSATRPASSPGAATAPPGSGTPPPASRSPRR